ncbi:MAG: hypothetical protein SO251_00795 [Candidatus Fimisoma sp.]|nr:hypothetical protein [Candidatus Fimisoma sp.]
MEKNLPSKYNKLIYITDIIEELLNKAVILLIIATVAFVATFGYHYMRKINIGKEQPCYSSAINVHVNSEFDNYSILKASEIAFSEQVIRELMIYEGFSFDLEDIRKSIIYSAESKYILQVRVYAKDTDTLAKIMDGIINICLPIIKDSSDATEINHSFEYKENKVKISNYVNIGEKGPVDAIGEIISWTEYLSSVSIFRIVKNSVVISVCLVFIFALIIALRRMLTRKLIVPEDVEDAVKLPVLAVVDDCNNGTEFVTEIIKASYPTAKRIVLFPLLESDKTTEVIKGIKEKDKNIFVEAEPFSKSADILNLINYADAVMIMYEDLKATDIQMINAVNTLYAVGIDNVGVITTNVKEKKIRRRKAYFGKYYPDSQTK